MCEDYRVNGKFPPQNGYRLSMDDMSTKWLIIGISGTTCSGKTTLANSLKKLFPDIKYIHQDSYFLPITSEKHVLVPELNHFNWELLSSLDMEQMYLDIKKIVNEKICTFGDKIIDKKILRKAVKKLDNRNDVEFIEKMCKEKNVNIFLIEGFSIFNYKPVEALCNLKFYLTLSYETCFNRRMNRVYDPPDVPGYFDKCVWPEHIKQLREVEENVTDVLFLEEDMPNKFDYILKCVRILCEAI